MKKRCCSIIAMLIVVAIVLASCSGVGNSLSVPKAMIGSWYDSESGARITATSDNIILLFSASTAPEYDFRSMIEISPQTYDVSSNDTSLSIRINGMSSSGYFFTVNGDTLTLRITAGSSTRLTFDRN